MSHVRIAEMLAESGLAREEMTDVFDQLLALDDLVGAAPAPSAELAALLGPERPAAARPKPLRGGRGAVAGVVVLALSGVGATGLSAAANTLPRPLQHRVSQFSQDYLPFDLPEPPATHHRSLGLPALTPLPTEDHGDEPASRSTPGREALDPPANTLVPPSAQAEPSPSPSTAEPSSRPSAPPSAGPSYAMESAGPTPSGPTYAPGSPTSSEGPRDDTGKGHQSPHPEKGGPATGKPGKGKPDTGKPGKDNGSGKGGGQDSGGHGSAPSPDGPAPMPNVPTPAPEEPAPTLPLPNPLPDLLPDLGGGGGTGSADAG